MNPKPTSIESATPQSDVTNTLYKALADAGMPGASITAVPGAHDTTYRVIVPRPAPKREPRKQS